MKKHHFTILLILIFLSCTEIQKNNVICIINDREILLDNFYQYYNKSHFRESTLAEQKHFVNDYINKLILIDEAEKLNLYEQRIVLSEIRLYTDNKIIDEVIEKNVWEPLLSNKSLKQLYNRLKKEIGVKHIVIPFNGCRRSSTERSKEDAYKLTLDIYSKINKKNLSFEQAAIKYSEDPSAIDFGNLGYHSWGENLFEPVQSAAFGLELRELSKPILSKFGYHLVFVFGIKTKPLPPFEEYSNQLKNFLRSRQGPEFDSSLYQFEQKLTEKYSIWIDEKSITKIYEKLVSDHKGNMKMSSLSSIDVPDTITICKVGDKLLPFSWLKKEIDSNKYILQVPIYSKEDLKHTVLDIILRYTAKLESATLDHINLANIRFQALDKTCIKLEQVLSKHYNTTAIQLIDSLRNVNNIIINRAVFQ